MLVHRKKSFQCDVCKVYFTFLTGLSKHKKKNRCKGPPDENYREKLGKEEIARIAREQLLEITVNPKKAEVTTTTIDFEFEAKKSFAQSQPKRTLVKKKSPQPKIIQKPKISQQLKSPQQLKNLPQIEQDDLPLSSKPAVVVRNLTEQEIEQQVVTSTSGRIIKRKQPTYITTQQRPSKTAKKGSYACDCCNLTFNTKTALVAHMDTVKSIAVKNKCTSCDITFPSSSEFRAHNNSVHQISIPQTPKEKKYECDLCGKKYVSNHLLQIHKKSHENLKEYKCGTEDCNFETNSPYDLNNHIKRKHNAVRSFECLICFKKFKRRCDLKNHTETVHSDVKTYVKCPKCEAIVLEKGLHSHVINRHSEKAKIKPYVCNICGKAERYEKNLQRHYDAVHEPKDRGVIYECPECPEKFYRRREMTAHSFVHFKGTVYICNMCGNKYKSKKELTNHEYTHRPIEYPCPLCNQVFQTKSGRGKHLNRHKEGGEDVSNLILPKKLINGDIIVNEVIAILPDDAEITEEIYEGYEMLDEANYVNME
jgi:hypothetical protein